jgi:phospholipid/cholesterol/gamma-HCH transport system substrate-binding protein
MNRNIIETIMGGVVLIIAVVFLVFAYSSSNSGAVSGYVVTAKFGRVDGLRPGAEVRLSGIKVGSVLDTELDPATYTANVRFSVSDSVKLPTDTSARIASDGLLGSNYLDLQPGAEEKLIGPGGEIPLGLTQNPVNIVDLVSRFVFGGIDTKKEDKGASGGQSQPQQ